MACVCARSEALRVRKEEEGLDEPLLDLEVGPSHGNTVAPPANKTMQEAMEANLTDAQKAELDAVSSKIARCKTMQDAMDAASSKTARCIGRAVLALLWVYLVDLFRRFFITHNEGLWTMVTYPLAIVATDASIIFFYLMEMMDQLIPIPVAAETTSRDEVDEPNVQNSYCDFKASS